MPPDGSVSQPFADWTLEWVALYRGIKEVVPEWALRHLDRSFVRGPLQNEAWLGAISNGRPYRVKLSRKVESQVVLRSEQMSNTITVRLPEDLAGWLEETSRKAGVPRGRIIREQLELARRRHDQPFLHLAGSVEGSRDLSARKGFAKR